jgi:hypothetical protein
LIGLQLNEPVQQQTFFIANDATTLFTDPADGGRPGSRR